MTALQPTPGTASGARSADSDTGLGDRIAAAIHTYPDFPTPGIMFRDLCPVFAMPQLRRAIGQALAERYAGRFDRLLAIEARGFIVGTTAADASDRPLTLARKSGKLPGPVRTAQYALEYGTAALEVQEGAFAPGERVLVVDDVLATGGTLAAAGELVRNAGATLAGYGVVLCLADLGGVARLAPVPTFSLLTIGD